jgi:hypothetical protein
MAAVRATLEAQLQARRRSRIAELEGMELEGLPQVGAPPPPTTPSLWSASPAGWPFTVGKREVAQSEAQQIHAQMSMQ